MCTLWKGVRWKALEEGELLLSCRMLQEDLAKEIRSPKSSQWEAQKHTSSDEGNHWSDTEMGKELTFIRTRLGQSPNKRRDREKWGIWEETGTEWERTGRGKGGDQDQVQKLFWNGVDNKSLRKVRVGEWEDYKRLSGTPVHHMPTPAPPKPASAPMTLPTPQVNTSKIHEQSPSSFSSTSTLLSVLLLPQVAKVSKGKQKLALPMTRKSVSPIALDWDARISTSKFRTVPVLCA